MKFKTYLFEIYRLNGLSSTVFIWRHYKTFKEWKWQLDSGKQPLEMGLPWITIEAKNYLVDFFKKNKNSIVFEFGSGGSSIFFSKYVNKVISVEHDKIWFEALIKKVEEEGITNWEGTLAQAETKSSSDLEDLLSDEPMHYYTADSNYKDSIFYNYCTKIEDYKEEMFDVILIDGRSRPSCIYHSYQKLSIGGLLVIDNSERDYYYTKTQAFLKNYELVVNSNSALICSPQFTQTNIFKKIK